MYELYHRLQEKGFISRKEPNKIPGLFDDDTIAEAETEFVDLAEYTDKINSLKKAKIATYFLIREEYEILDHDLKNKYKEFDTIILMGQPGIGRFDPYHQAILSNPLFRGKTMYLTHRLIQRLILGLPTIFSSSPKHRYLFRDSKVYYIPDRSGYLNFSSFLSASPDESALEIIDLNDQQEKVSQISGWPCLIATSPQPKGYKKFKTQQGRDATIHVMLPWTWEEIYVVR